MIILGKQKFKYIKKVIILKIIQTKIHINLQTPIDPLEQNQNQPKQILRKSRITKHIKKSIR